MALAPAVPALSAEIATRIISPTLTPVAPMVAAMVADAVWFPAPTRDVTTIATYTPPMPVELLPYRQSLMQRDDWGLLAQLVFAGAHQ